MREQMLLRSPNQRRRGFPFSTGDNQRLQITVAVSDNG
jgi:hypothetical protein